MNRATLPLILALAACPKSDSGSTTAPTPIDPFSTEGISASVESALDRSTNPCDDFYQFACGGWLEQTAIPDDRPRVSRSFTSIYERNQATVREVLDDAASGKIEADPRLGAFYKGCMDTTAIDTAGAAPLKPWLGEIGTVKDGASLSRILGKVPLMRAFFDGGVDSDFKNPDTNILHVSQGGLGLPEKSYYTSDDPDKQSILADYKVHVGKMLAAFGLDESKAEAIVALETRLATASRPAEAMRDVMSLYDKMDRGGWQALMPNLPLDPMFEAYGAPDLTDINVMTPEFFGEVDTIVAEGDWDTIRAYLSWQLIRSAAPYLSSEIDTAHFEFFGTRMSGQKSQQDRWKRCVDRTDDELGDLLGQAWVDRAFAGDSKAKALEMIMAIEHAFEEGLPELEWMDNTTRKHALAKLGTITNKIGYPDKWETYDNLTVSGKHFDDKLALVQWLTAKELAKVGQPVDKSQWYMTPPTVNAYYNPLVNEIVFPAGILQPPFFSSRYPVAMNYGAMGMVMGHEVTHGFDDEGRKFAPDGSLKEWWAPEASERFDEAAQCVVDLYDTFEVLPGVTVNGELTLGENIADLGGIGLAAAAYEAWVAKGNSDPSIAGFTSEQLLYVSFAQGWCTKATPEYVKRQVSTDPHSPSRSRVNGPLSQHRGFGEAFECDSGAPMMPTEICSVW